MSRAVQVIEEMRRELGAESKGRNGEDKDLSCRPRRNTRTEQSHNREYDHQPSDAPWVIAAHSSHLALASPHPAPGVHLLWLLSVKSAQQRQGHCNVNLKL